MNQEAALKKRLQFFLADLSKVGTTKGFKHFSCYIRGKEELIISIKNTLPPSTTTGQVSLPSQKTSRKQSLKPSDSFDSSYLPYNKNSLTLSHNTQVGLSGMRDVGIGLPPASPSEQESTEDKDTTKFLIAGYSRYSCPYVWIRSNHERLMKVAVSSADVEKDSPLRLKSTTRWHETDVYVYEIIAELVKLCMYPAPRNPFELDFHYFRNLTQPHQCLMSSAMISFLDRVITHSQDSCPYSRKVFQEHQLLSKLHFSALHDLIQSDYVPRLKGATQAQLENMSIEGSSSLSSSTSSYRAPKNQPNTGHTRSPEYAAPKAAINSQHKHNMAMAQNTTLSSSAAASSATATGTPAIRSTVPVNTSRSVRYGQGPSGAFPGGFDRMPAPSMF